MNKRIISLFLSLALIWGMCLSVSAAPEETNQKELTISTREEFLAFAENCRLDAYSVDLAVTLAQDIDLTGCSFESIPVFSGSFDGNGHTVSGLELTADGSVVGLFRYLTETAQVKNLSVTGVIQPGGSRTQVGGIAGNNQGNISGCTVNITLSGAEQVGGIVGVNEVLGVIEDCRVSGSIQGNHFAGGIAGENNGVIRACTSQAQINTTPQQNDVEITDVTIDSMLNTEAANTATDIGGIAGISTGVIRDCVNRGPVGYRYMGYNVGGIAGTQSGYLVGCENHGQIQGRKEVGGIVGQMEPSAMIEYSQDTLQILKEQLNDLAVIVEQAKINSQANAAYLSGQIAALQDQADNASLAANGVLTGLSNPETIDPDALLANLNALSQNLSAMPKTLQGIVSAAENTAQGLSGDLDAISRQIGVIGETLNNAPEDLGGSLTDLSDLDTPDQLTGKTEACVNYGTVLADLNTGGIAGAMAVENDLDILEDWEQTGEVSLNFQSRLRSVILGCENRGKVMGRKQNAGGIVGWQSLGLVKNCANTAAVDGTGAGGVGGISGASTGFIRGNYARCELYGKEYAGGIAGSATIATDNLSQVKLIGATEKTGAILGVAEEPAVREEQPIAGNYYLCVEKDPGAIDGISYAGRAEPMTLEAFMAQENLPEMFRSVTIRFVADGEVTELSVAPGEDLNLDQIPAVPKKEGYSGIWEGLKDAQLTNILFDMTFNGVYTSYQTTIESEETRENGLPLLLAEGSFSENVNISATGTEESPELGRKQTLLEVWKLTANEDVTTFRFRLPEGADGAHILLLGKTADGNWKEISFTQVGSYLVFAPEERELTLAVVETPSSNLIIYLAAAVALIGAAALTVVLCKKKKKPAQTQESNE